MLKKNKINLFISVVSLFSFVLWTFLIQIIDVKAIGPNASVVGFSTLNQYFYNLTGVCMPLYTVTDWLGLVPIAFALGFAILGLIQWIKRKNIIKVDYSILILGCFYILTIIAYILFEYIVINYRPTLINGFLEVSYPSSTTLLVLCVMPTAIMQFNTRIKNCTLKSCITMAITAFIILMVIGRLVSGVHWLTDIVGGALLSSSLVFFYRFLCNLK